LLEKKEQRAGFAIRKRRHRLRLPVRTRLQHADLGVFDRAPQGVRRVVLGFRHEHTPLQAF
jgi:hypothetical protein